MDDDEIIVSISLKDVLRMFNLIEALPCYLLLDRAEGGLSRCKNNSFINPDNPQIQGVGTCPACFIKEQLEATKRIDQGVLIK